MGSILFKIIIIGLFGYAFYLFFMGTKGLIDNYRREKNFSVKRIITMEPK